MKKNYFNILFLSSALLLAVCGCDNPTQETGTSEPGQQQIQTNDNLKVELNRRVYVQGEDLDVKEVSVYSPHYDSWSPQPMFNTKMPATCPNGVAYATVSVGQMKTSVEIMYFTSAEEAAKGMNIQLPEDVSKYYKESDYIKSGKLTFSSYVQDGVLFANDPKKESTVNQFNKATKNPQYNANYIDVWTEAGATAAMYDANRLTIPHYQVTTTPEDGSDSVTTTYAHTTYLPPENEYSANLMYEIITEADGSVCYLAPITHTETDPILPTATDKYWSKYKDYTQNPCFIYAEDYNAETNPTAFEKVLPEGGQWVVGVNNATSNIGKIDNLLREMTGNDSLTASGSNANFQLYWGGQDSLDESHAGIEEKLMQTKVKCVKNSKGKNVVSVFGKASAQHSYAYYLLEATAANKADEYKAELYNAVVYLGMPEVKNEPVLYNYYSEVCTTKLEEWAAKL